MFASTTIATSILSKIGEDIYTQLKTKIAAAFPKKNGVDYKKMGKEAKLTITVIVNELDDPVAIQGQVNFDSVDTAVEALKAAQQMLIQAHSMRDGHKDLQERGSQGEPDTHLHSEIIEEQFIIDELCRPRSWLKYHYDTLAANWVPTDIDRGLKDDM